MKKCNIDERDRKLQEQECFHLQESSGWEDIVEALRSPIKKPKEAISIKESDREKVRDSMEVEKALRGQKRLKKKNSEMVTPNGEMERRT